ncbi:MAG TPA: hypothetical protein VKU60_14925 [Chloroflexota bacterium]|nr:hypothetical protein [Chloroflexota bacterium]
MPNRTGDLHAERADIVTQLNSVNRAICFIDHKYFSADPMPGPGYVAIAEARRRRAVAPEVREAMAARLAELRVQQARLLSQLADIDHRIPEPWYSR